MNVEHLRMRGDLIGAFTVFQAGMIAAYQHPVIVALLGKGQKPPDFPVLGDFRLDGREGGKGGVIAKGIRRDRRLVHVQMGEGVVDEAEICFVGHYRRHQVVGQVRHQCRCFRIHHRSGTVERQIQLISAGHRMRGAKGELFAHCIGNVGAVQAVDVRRDHYC